MISSLNKNNFIHRQNKQTDFNVTFGLLSNFLSSKAMRHFYASNAPPVVHAPQVGHPWVRLSFRVYLLCLLRFCQA